MISPMGYSRKYYKLASDGKVMPYEQPIYSVLPHQGRALVPKALSLIGLGIIFYIGVLVNVTLLDLRATEETVVKVVALAVVLCLIIVGIILARRHTMRPYVFYRDGIEVNEIKIRYSTITIVDTKQNLWDKIFTTQKIVMGSTILHHVPEELALEGYIRKVIEYAKNRP